MDRRAALEAAFDKHSEEETEDTSVIEGESSEVEQEATEDSQDTGEQIREKDAALEMPEGGKKEPKTPSSEPMGAKAKETQPKEKKEDEALGRAAQAASGGADTKPPISWKAAAKEQWAKLPLDIKNEVLRRETEISKYISANDHHRKFTEGFAKTVQPFMPLIQAQGSTPLQAVRNLMTTAAGLSTGSTEQKARIVAEIIGNYGVDVETLDKILASGAHKTSNSGSGHVDPAIMQALRPMYEFMGEVRQAREMSEQRKRQEAEALIEQHSNLPFFDDLAEDIADIMEIAAKRGVELNLQQAYEKAVALNPDISKVINQRKAAEEARANGGTRLAKAKRAASTITGAPVGGSGGSSAPKSRRDALEAAWEEHASH